ncbi:hypothetical protein GGR57DRAFT_221417 [Xylariaceae sp. FL1272]|nr:hypothetical protein GGR57DRAFT_221417 [Xylariaceae sp. FL1272]
MEGMKNAYDIPGTSNRLYIGLFYDREPNGACISGFQPTIGSSENERLNNCVDRFNSVLDDCQKTTTTAKRGGFLHDYCRIYAITARSADDGDPWEHWFGPRGDFACRDTNTTGLPGDHSDVQNSCSCWYSEYPNIWDYFRKPDGGCDPSKVDKTALIRD